MKVRVAIYTRVSTDLQAAGENNSLDHQESRLVAYAKSMKEDNVVVGVFRDEGESGKSIDRPALRRLMAAVDAGEVDRIIVTKIDRLTRSLPDFYKLHEALEARSVQFASLDNSFDTSTAQGRAFLNMILVFAQLEREQTGERTRAAMQERARKGLYNGGPPILGYDKGPDGRLAINDGEATVVRAAFAKLGELKSAPATSKWLNEQGYRTKRYTPRRTGALSGGKKFTPAKVRVMVRRKVYLGHTEYKGDIIEDTHPAVVLPDDFARAAGVLEANGKNQRTPASSSPKRVYLLAGVARCECGAALSPHPGGKYHYYRCVAVSKGTEAGQHCKVKQVGALALERAVVRLMRDAARQQGLIASAVEEANHLVGQSLDPARARLRGLAADLERVKGEARGMAMNLAKQDLAEDDFVREVYDDLCEQMKQLTGAVEAQKAELHSLDSRHVDLEIVRESLQNFDSAFDLLNEGEKKEFLRLMVRKVVVHPTEVEVEVYEGESFSAPVQGLKGTRGGKNVRLSPEDVNAGVFSKSAPEQQSGTKSGSDDPRLRARCDMAPRDGLEPPTRWLTATCSTN